MAFFTSFPSLPLRSHLSTAFICLSILIGFFCGCSPDRSPTDISFYYWKTRFDLRQDEQDLLKQVNSRKIYIRYFDVGLKSGQAFPIGSIVFKDIPQQEIIPVVYIKNEVMLSENVDVAVLAEKITGYIAQINRHYGISSRELQLDCDWTQRSKDKFFQLLKELRSTQRGVLSCTIRLHQVKYAQRTGVPPVDYGVLMYYNMGSLSANQTNSIYDRKTAALYNKSLAHYPLKLKVALPIFSWGIQLRQGKVINLLNRLRVEELQDPSIFRRREDGKFEIIREGSYFGRLFAAGDLIKLENITPGMLTEMADDLNSNLKNKPSEIIFYDLDRSNIEQYEHIIFKEISTRFH